MQEKINEINNLNRNIKELKDFLHLCNIGSKESNYGTQERPKYNKFTEMIIGSNVWTGSDNPKYIKSIHNSDDINFLTDCFKQNLEILIKQKESKLAELLDNRN
jgi:hypothetical protein